MSSLIAALDSALAGYGENVILRRIVGTAPNQIPIDVECRARVTAVSLEQIVAGIPSTEFNVIISPTQINEKQWPGGTIPPVPPLTLDQRIPRAGLTDKMILKERDSNPRAVTFSDPQIVGSELVRINLRVSG